MIAVHMLGYPAATGELRALCAEHGLALIEDAAQGFGVDAPARADVACLSFFSKKQLAVGEGGMVLTDDEALAERGPAAALARHDLRHVGPPPRPRGLLRRRRLRLQLPARRAARRARPRRGCRRSRRRSSIGARWSAPTASGSAPTRCSTTRRSSARATSPSPSCSRTSRRASACGRRWPPRAIQTTRYPALHRLTEFARYATPLPHSAAAADRHLALPLSAHTTLEQVERVSAVVLRAAAGRA